MLCSLELENFLLFERAEFVFAPGLNAVSGETGAGKSLVARALGLVLGGRGGHDAVRRGCGEARVRACFQAGPAWPAAAAGWADAGGGVAVERTLRREGGGITVNGKARTIQAVRQTLAPLVDFAAQNEQTRLADPPHQLELLDAYGGLAGARERYLLAWRAAESLSRRLLAGREERELVRLRLERAREEIREIEAIGFDPAADPFLEDAIREMSHAAGVAQAAAEALELLEGGERPALEALSQAWRAAERLAGVSPRLSAAGQGLAAALEAIGAAQAALASVSGDAGADPARLDALISRSERLKALARRLDCRAAELPAILERLRREAEELSGWDAGEEETRSRLAEALPRAAAVGLELGAARRGAAKRLAAAVNAELAELGMEQAGFEAVFEPAWREGEPLERVLDAGPSGLDEMGFFLTPNPGEPASAVSGGTSGGEASRAALALKAALSEVYRPDLMFLDEVDAGVGARLGRELGAKLRSLAERRQVIVITHLPQIAAHAARHFRVAKRVGGGRTLAAAERLDGEERVREVAGMIHGASAGEAALRQAREMLAEGGAAGRGRSMERA